MNTTDSAITFACEGDTLVGVATLPCVAGDTGVLIIVGGPQYRAGSHRQFVQLARCVAAAGFPVLRFDSRGMGDSSGTPRNFEHISADIGCAISALMAQAPTVKRVVLWGLCDGASAALLYLHQHQQDPRVGGLCLLNPWARSETTLARTHVKHYYKQRLMQRDFWAKLLRGGVAWQALRGLFGNLQKAAASAAPMSAEDTGPYTRRMALGWQGFKGPILLVLSGNDLTAQEFTQVCGLDPTWQAALRRTGVTRIDLSGADHTLSEAPAQLRFEAGFLAWLKSTFNETGIHVASCVLSEFELDSKLQSQTARAV